MLTSSGIVRCEATGELCLVYRARTERQVRNGHEPGKWYARPIDQPGSAPITNPYDTAAEVIGMLDRPSEQAATVAPDPVPLRAASAN